MDTEDIEDVKFEKNRCSLENYALLIADIRDRMQEIREAQGIETANEYGTLMIEWLQKKDMQNEIRAV